MTTTSPAMVTVPEHAVRDLPWEALTGHGVSNKVLYASDGTVAGLLRFRPGAREISHLHGAGQHHLWVLAGTIVVGDHSLSSGSYVHVPEQLTHAVRDAGDGSIVFYVFSPSG